MWICFKDSFLSIVEDTRDANKLLVRARVAGDIERIFGYNRVEVIKGAGTDYQYRASIDAHTVANTLRREILAIDYPNFKDSVKDDCHHNAYMDVWVALRRAFFLK